MTYTLGNLTYLVAVEQGVVREGLATGGSTTTLIDTVNRTEADDYWNGGTVWVLYDAAGAGAAPQGEWGIVSDFTQSTKTANITALTTAIAANDRYGIADKRVPIDILIQKINQALVQIGPIPKYEDITPANDQTEYVLTDTLANDIRRVRYQTNLDTNDNRWQEITGWEVYDPNSAGTAHTLRLPVQLDPSYTVRVDYVGPHARMQVVGDKLDESIPHELVVYLAVAECLLFRRQRADWNKFDDDIREYRRKAELIRQSRPVMPWVAKPNRILSANKTDRTYEGTVNKVRL